MWGSRHHLLTPGYNKQIEEPLEPGCVWRTDWWPFRRRCVVWSLKEEACGFGCGANRLRLFRSWAWQSLVAIFSGLCIRGSSVSHFVAAHGACTVQRVSGEAWQDGEGASKTTLEFSAK